ncbi:MAG: hypothetical protein KAI81_07505, partial [Candidatus Marinimicrobia bacterium]|nr:hypothetical protein [Candidatus Neomarinimicrobiota bacterium]
QATIELEPRLQASAYYINLQDLEYQWGGQLLPELKIKRMIREIPLQFILMGNLSTSSEQSEFGDNELEWYRTIMKLSGDNYDFKLGLQKINFGPAQFLRTLQWFDTLNPLDPTGQSDAVEAALLRFAPHPNLYIWAWGINNETIIINPLTIMKDDIRLFTAPDPNIRITNQIGGRIIFNYGMSEIATTIFHRTFSGILPSNENRIAFDIRSEYIIGIWAEIMISLIPENWIINAPKRASSYTFGADYTFPLGNGLYTVVEHAYSDAGNIFYDNYNVFQAKSRKSMLMLNFPLSIFDNLMNVSMVDHQNEMISNTLIWSRSYDHLILNLNVSAIKIKAVENLQKA